MKKIEEAAFARGVDPADLMEEAGCGIARVIEQFFPLAGTCVVYCGRGNNAGDALVAARYLAEHDWNIIVRLASPLETMAPLAQAHFKRLLEQDGVFCRESAPQVETYPLILLDGLLGIGSQGEPRDSLVMLIEEMKELRGQRGGVTVAVDLPSGIHATTGRAASCCVDADLTVTIADVKTGLLADSATDYVGRLALVPLAELISEESLLITPLLLRKMFPPRSFDVHKGLFGHVGIIAGSVGYLGAARLTSRAALHSGAGLVTLYALPETYELLALAAPPEVMVKPISCYTDVLSEPLDALAIGPGLGSKHYPAILEVIEKMTVPSVIDADALNALASDMSRLSTCQGARLLTPHPGEMERLFARQSRTRLEWASDFVKHHRVTLLLKGARTIIAENGKPALYNSTGNPGMATGGMGDLLTGVAASLLAGRHSCREAAALGAWICGRAAELAVFEGSSSQESLIATDVTDSLGRAMKDLRRGVY